MERQNHQDIVHYGMVEGVGQEQRRVDIVQKRLEIRRRDLSRTERERKQRKSVGSFWMR